MNKILYFIAGAVLGAGGSYLYLNKKYEERLNKEINEIVRKDIDAMRKNDTSSTQTLNDDSKVKFNFDSNKDYSIYDTKTEEIPEDVVVSPVDIDNCMLEESEIIDENEFEDDYYDEDGNKYDKKELLYFTNNDVFADEESRPLNEQADQIFVNDEMMENIVDILHDDESNGECYLRCHNTKTDYCIICDFRDFRQVGVFLNG